MNPKELGQRIPYPLKRRTAIVAGSALLLPAAVWGFACGENTEVKRGNDSAPTTAGQGLSGAAERVPTAVQEQTLSPTATPIIHGEQPRGPENFSGVDNSGLAQVPENNGAGAEIQSKEADFTVGDLEVAITGWLKYDSNVIVDSLTGKSETRKYAVINTIVKNISGVPITISEGGAQNLQIMTDKVDFLTTGPSESFTSGCESPIIYANHGGRFMFPLDDPNKFDQNYSYGDYYDPWADTLPAGFAIPVSYMCGFPADRDVQGLRVGDRSIGFGTVDKQFPLLDPKIPVLDPKAPLVISSPFANGKITLTRLENNNFARGRREQRLIFKVHNLGADLSNPMSAGADPAGFLGENLKKAEALIYLRDGRVISTQYDLRHSGAIHILKDGDYDLPLVIGADPPGGAESKSRVWYSFINQNDIVAVVFSTWPGNTMVWSADPSVLPAK